MTCAVQNECSNVIQRPPRNNLLLGIIPRCKTALEAGVMGNLVTSFLSGTVAYIIASISRETPGLRPAVLAHRVMLCYALLLSPPNDARCRAARFL